LKYQTRGTSKRVKDALPQFVDGKGWGGVQELQGVAEFRSSGRVKQTQNVRKSM
jgi:hypothetical protein